MKTSKDPRHLKRIKAIKELFAWNFSQTNQLNNPLAKKVVDNLAKIDSYILRAAPDRPIKQINRIDLTILRLAVLELVIETGTPYKVIVDEAVELAKEYGSDSSPGFVNGALGYLIEMESIDHGTKRDNSSNC